MMVGGLMTGNFFSFTKSILLYGLVVSYTFFPYQLMGKVLRKESFQTAEEIRIGIDVGGTNTDIALVAESSKKINVLTSEKVKTTTNPSDGVNQAIEDIVSSLTESERKRIKRVMLGSTQLLNAVAQSTGLNQAAVIRICLPSSTAIPPLTGWHESLVEALGGHDNVYLIHGGYEFYGSEIAKIREEELIAIADDLKRKGITSAAITGVFAHTQPTQELYVKNILTREYPELRCSLSHKIGGLGLRERENATAINACLLQPYERLYNKLKETLKRNQLQHCDVYVTKNDGTLERILTHEEQVPLAVCTINSGPTNSLIGASRVFGDRAVVVDIGGTTTDVGILEGNGVLAENTAIRELAKGSGVECTIRAPRVISTAFGGGSIITGTSNGDVTISGESVGNSLEEQAVSFGGSRLTLTDIALAKGRITMKNAQPKLLERHLGDAYAPTVTICWEAMHQKLAEVILEAWHSVKNRPETVLLIGGGASLFDREKLQALLPATITHISVPEHAEVMNAVGAALAQVGGQSIAVLDLEKVPKKDAIEKVTLIALQRAVNNGASPDILKRFTIKRVPKGGVPEQLFQNGETSTLYLQHQSSDTIYLHGIEKNGSTARVNLSALPHAQQRSYWETIKEKVLNSPIESLPGEVCSFFMTLLGYSQATIKNIEVEPIRYVKGKPHKIRVEVCAPLTNDHYEPVKEDNIGDIQVELVQEVGTCDEDMTEHLEGTFIQPSPTHIRDALSQHATIISQEDIEYLALGCGILGSGGGASTRFPRIILNNLFKTTGKLPRLINADDLPDDALVVSFGILGSPTIFEEKIPSNSEIIRSIETIERLLSREVDAILVAEIGGANGLVSLIASIEMNKPLIDADTMGRAFPRLSDVLPCINKLELSNRIYLDGSCKRNEHMGVLANIKTVKIAKGKTALELESHARSHAIDMGGWASLACFAMDGEQVKTGKFCIKGTVSTAIGIGRAIRNAQKSTSLTSPILESLNEYLKDTCYGVAQDAKELHGTNQLSVGRISDIAVREEDGFTFGTITVDYGSELLTLAVQNENLIVVKTKSDGTKELMVQVPSIITIVDADTFEPVPCATWRFNQRVSVLSIEAPAELRTPEALKVIGPKEYVLEIDKDPSLLPEEQQCYETGRMLESLLK